MKQNNRPTEVRTESDTRLFLQVGKSETETASGKRTEFVVGLSLERETGDSEDGEQITFLNASQTDTLIEQLSKLRNSVAAANKLNNKYSVQ